MTMSAMDTNRMISWFMARLGARRVTKVMPIPERKKTMGRIAGSAPGAKMRAAMCAAVKAANRPMGTASVWNDNAAPVPAT